MINICFCGVDGSGKSTQIELLKKKLNNQHIKFKYIHVLSKNNTEISKLHEKNIFSFLIKKIRGLKNNKIGIFIKIFSRLINLLVDSSLTFKKNNKSINHEMIIYDRYFYDILVILAFDFPKWQRLIFFFIKLIPQPDLIIIFKSTPSTVVKRKAEHSISQADSYCTLYKYLSKKLNIELIDSDQSIENIHQQILKLMPKFFIK